jgi:hypothetical protein
MEVFVLWHIHRSHDGDDEKLIGVYSSNTRAREAATRVAKQPGFVDQPNLRSGDETGEGGFLIDTYLVDEDHWTEGYVTEPLARNRSQGVSLSGDIPEH